MQNNQAIFESLFSRNFSDKDNHDFLQEITNEHPYFSPAQFYLLWQTATGTAIFEKQAAKTNILFNNPHWLNFQLQQTNPLVQEEEHIHLAEIKPVEAVEKNIDKLPGNAEDDYDDSPDNTDAPAPDSYREQTELEPMRIELKMPEEKNNLDEAMLFEPMHMVDYFASQGIKLTDEVQMADKLGKQMKSFTEWLKTMKKVHTENEVETTVQTDNSILKLAENSNTEAEVLTESMAEVFARQGKMGKASEVYQKLSLLNPAKSTYFAAKIENLKGI